MLLAGYSPFSIGIIGRCWEGLAVLCITPVLICCASFERSAAGGFKERCAVRQLGHELWASNAAATMQTAVSMASPATSMRPFTSSHSSPYAARCPEPSSATCLTASTLHPAGGHRLPFFSQQHQLPTPLCIQCYRCLAYRAKNATCTDCTILQVATDALTAMERAMARDNIQTNDRQLACARINSQEGQDYLSAMSCAANYAWVNRCLGKVCCTLP